MNITIAKNSGFCVGVKKAVDTALSVGNKGVYVLGELIHNETVLDEIAKKGVKTINDISEIEKGTLIIRSHGVSKEIIDKLSLKKDVKIIDCTCSFVKKIHKIVDEHYRNGYQIVIIGKAEHPEVVGINGWCENSAIILNDEENIPESVFIADKVCVVAQTTYSAVKFDKILKKITINSVKTVAVFKTICYTTMERQTEADDLSKKCEAMVVIGGKSSSNTKRLYEICKNNCKATYLITKPNGLDYKKLKSYKSVGIVCGASTPYEQAMEVFLTMEEREVNSMEQAVALLDEKQNLKRGQKISVVISQVLDDGLKVYFDGKTDITLLKEELAQEEFDKNAYSVGDEIEVIVMGTKPLSLSQKQILVLQKEEELVKELNGDVTINVQITGFNKGGLVGKYECFDVFVPAREIKIGFVSDLSKYTGKTLRVKPLKVEYTPRKKEIVASQKVILEAEKAQRDAEKAAKEEAFFSSIALNDVVTGTVARFASFGAFVVVNGFDCLAHVSDLSWTNVKNPSEVLELGKSYDFVVLKIDQENKKVSIGYKQLQPKPWELVSEKYSVGDVVTGKVVRIVDFGAFVEVEKGIDGLVHVSQISHEFLENPASALKVGDEVTAKILAIAPEKEKMNLSIKALIEAPKKEVVETEEKPKKEKKVKKEEDEELHSWTESATSEVSIADLLNK